MLFRGHFRANEDEMVQEIGGALAHPEQETFEQGVLHPMTDDMPENVVLLGETALEVQLRRAVDLVETVDRQAQGAVDLPCPVPRWPW